MRRRLGLASRGRSVPIVRHRPLALAAFALFVLLGCGGPAPGPTITVQGRVEAPLVGPLANVVVHLQGTLATTTTTAFAAGVDGFAFGAGGPGPGTRAAMAKGPSRRFTLAP